MSGRGIRGGAGCAIGGNGGGTTGRGSGAGVGASESSHAEDESRGGAMSSLDSGAATIFHVDSPARSSPNAGHIQQVSSSGSPEKNRRRTECRRMAASWLQEEGRAQGEVIRDRAPVQLS
jgi:hypothetical protein